jgi:predicted GIY-YIG superfamily endonuclease
MAHPGERSVGLTTDLRRRFDEHNTGKSSHTSKFKPWPRVCVVVRAGANAPQIDVSTDQAVI